MDAKQAAVYGVFTGMAILDRENDSDVIDVRKINFYADRILNELNYKIPDESSKDDFHFFIAEINKLCGDIMLK